MSKGGRCCGVQCYKPKEVLVHDLSTQIQAGSKFAIVSEGANGKSTILNTLLSRRTAFHVSGLLKRQVGSGTPIYSSQNSDVLFEDLTLKQNLDYYIGLGAVHSNLVCQMVDTFEIAPERQNVPVRDAYETERHLVQLILALAGSRRTLILDEPFIGLSRDQSLKLVRIIRQKHGCTVIVTAKSKSEIELFQPHTTVSIRDKHDKAPVED